MSSDLLAEFDSFYRAPNAAPINSAPASNDLSFLADTRPSGTAGGTQEPSNWTDFSSQATQAAWLSMEVPSSGTIQKQEPVQDDIWGSFETDAQNPPYPRVNTDIALGSAAAIHKIQNKPEILRRSTLDMFSQETVEWPELHVSKNVSRYTPQPSSRPVGNNNMYGDVLFDAMDDLSAEPENDDEFGDFETGTSSAAPQPLPQPQTVDLLFDAAFPTSQPVEPQFHLSSLSISSPSAGLPYPQAPKSPSFQQRNPFSDLGLATKGVNNAKQDVQAYSESPVTAWPTFKSSVPRPAPYVDSPAPPPTQDDDEWGDFEDLPPTKPTATSPNLASGIDVEARAWDTADRVSDEHSSSPNLPPPTNIPPPSILLTLFTPLFSVPQSTLFQSLATQPSTTKNRILSSPATIFFLRSYLLIATVSARIIAGRKQRWKRDTLLSQSMKIGPSSTGGKRGMKLTGVDKAEIAKEDREVADVIQVWRDHLGRLRSAIAVANSSMRGTESHLMIPEISENMTVQTQEGALSAPRACAVCGLRREERVTKVDFEVEDSFGEWWVEFWGHRACRNFWMEHEGNLKGR